MVDDVKRNNILAALKIGIAATLLTQFILVLLFIREHKLIMIGVAPFLLSCAAFSVVTAFMKNKKVNSALVFLIFALLLAYFATAISNGISHKSPILSIFMGKDVFLFMNLSYLITAALAISLAVSAKVLSDSKTKKTG